MNTTLIEGKSLAGYDPAVLNILGACPHAPRHDAASRLLIGVRNERGEVYRVIRMSGLQEFCDMLDRFRELGFRDDLAESHGDKEGFDAVVSKPGSA